MEITVCVGSSCHMKGSYQVITVWKDLIKQHHLEDQITLKASFCMGRCLEGIAVTLDGEPLQNVGFSNASELFFSKVLPAAGITEQIGGHSL